MEEDTIMRMDQNGLTVNLAGSVREMIRDQGEAVRAMAEMLRVSNERMAAMEEEMRGLREAVRTLEKVTPAQAATINRLIQQRALDLCEEYRIGDCGDPRKESGKKGPGRPGISREAKALGAMIRADVRTLTGTRTVREIARCDWETAVDYITGWDDYEKIMKVKAAQKKRGVQA